MVQNGFRLEYWPQGTVTVAESLNVDSEVNIVRVRLCMDWCGSDMKAFIFFSFGWRVMNRDYIREFRWSLFQHKFEITTRKVTFQIAVQHFVQLFFSCCHSKSKSWCLLFILKTQKFKTLNLGFPIQIQLKFKLSSDS